MNLSERKKRTVSGSSDEDSDTFVERDSVDSTSIQQNINSPSRQPARKKRYIDSSLNEKKDNNNKKDKLKENENQDQNEGKIRGEEDEDQQTKSVKNNKSKQPSIDPQDNIKSTKSLTKSSDKVTDNTTDTQVLSQQPSIQEEKKPRLVIKKMVLNNFKSYAGRQVIGPFHTSFSAVVGPNGSGKSNVIDALLFVFGYRANKMRQGKLSELIHNSARFPNLDSCSVEVHFEEIIDSNIAGKHEVVPNSRLVVARQASKNNSSKYFINERSSTYSDVTTLLRKRGIDLDHKRFLILQGEVESIALMKAKAKDDNDDGLLEYLEDIIGTSKYKDTISKANDSLEKINEIRAEKLNRVKFVAKERESLEDKKAEAENYLENENELSKRKNELYQIYRYEAEINMEVAKKAVDELNVKLKEEEDKHVEIEREITDKQNTYQDSVKEYKKLESDHSKIIKLQTKLENEDVKLRANKEHIVIRKEKGKQSIESDEEALEKAQTAITKNVEEIKKRQTELKNLEKQKKTEEKKLNEIQIELQGKTEGIMAQIEEHKKQLEPWTEKINAKKKAIDVKNSEKEILSNRISSGQKAVEVAEQQLAKLESTKKKKLKELETLPAEINELRSEIDEIALKIKDVEERETLYKKDVSLARQKADEAKASMQQSQNRGKVLKDLIRMRDSGRIKGIYDRMGNLGVIDDKYDIAISTACPALDNIVVDTVEAAQACIEYLRKNNLGRAVFTVLEKLKKENMAPINTPDNVPRLFDLVKPREEKFAPAFYSVLKDTIVAHDLKQANQIAFGKKRWRVVTLDGKLIEKSGAMTGGGNRQLKGAMSSRFKNDEINPDVVASLEKERNDLELEYRNVTEEKRALELVLRTKRSSLPKKEIVLEKLQMDSRSLDTQLEDDTNRLNELRKNTKPSPQDVKRLEEIGQEIDQLNTEMDELKEKTVSLEETIQSLQEDILDAGGMDLRLQKICVNDITKKIDASNEKITKCTVLKSKAEKDIIKLQTNIKKTEKELESFESELSDIDEQIRTKVIEIDDVKAKADEIKETMETKKTLMDEMKNELETLTSDITEYRKSKVEINNQLENYQKSYSDNEKKCEHWSDQRAKLTMHKLWNAKDEDNVLKVYDITKVKELQQDKQAIKGEIAEIEAFVQNAKPNLSVLEEYRRRDEEYNERAADLNEITQERNSVKSEVDSLRKKRLDEFMHGFNIISQKLKEMYQMITLGGNAELELVDSLDPFSEGIVFSVMPPKKSWKNISNLSGGEKTLSSLALVFALHHFKPTPLYVMDEIDAALDFRNVSIVANYIAERTKDAQFVIISLRNNMFELADRLVGIYKTSNCTKSIAINPSMIATLTTLTNTNNNNNNINMKLIKRSQASSTSAQETQEDNVKQLK